MGAQCPLRAIPRPPATGLRRAVKQRSAEEPVAWRWNAGCGDRAQKEAGEERREGSGCWPEPATWRMRRLNRICPQAPTSIDATPSDAPCGNFTLFVDAGAPDRLSRIGGALPVSSGLRCVRDRTRVSTRSTANEADSFYRVARALSSTSNRVSSRCGMLVLAAATLPTKNNILPRRSNTTGRCRDGFEHARTTR